MLENDFDDIEIIDVDDLEEIEILDVDFDEELVSFETGSFLEEDLLNEVVIQPTGIDASIISDLSNEKGFSHVLLYSFLGGFTGGIILTVILHLTHIL